MNAPLQDAVRFDSITEVTWTQLVKASGMDEAELAELVRYGALEPRNPNAPTWTLESHGLLVARNASRMRRDFDLDPHGVSVVLSFLDRIEALEAELRALRAQVG